MTPVVIAVLIIGFILFLVISYLVGKNSGYLAGQIKGKDEGIAQGTTDGYTKGYQDAVKKIPQERKEAVKDSREITRGNINEEISALLPHFPGNFSEARHVGKPIDFLIFKGMDGGDITEIGFVEVKTGKSDLNTNERRVRDIILEAKEKGARLKWDIYNLDEEVAKKLSEEPATTVSSTPPVT